MLISVITPCYNLKNYIRETYESIKNQTYREWEWIIVDDASTDDTREVIEQFNDPRVKLVKSQHTGNLAILRNKGVRIAKGDYLAFVDGDDICEPEKFHLQLQQLETLPTLGWNHTNIKILNESTDKLEDRKRPASDAPVVAADDAFSMLTFRNFVCVSTVMIRKKVFEAVGGFDEKFHRCEDINLWLRLSASGFSMGYLKEFLLRYRVRSGGLYVSKTLEYLNMNFVVYDDIQKKFPELAARHQSSIKRHLSDVHLKIGIRLLMQNLAGYDNYFRESFKLAPSVKKLGWLLLSKGAPNSVRKYLTKRLQ